MRILLTGAAGRLGSHTLKYLLRRGHTIIALDRVDIPSWLLESLSDLSAAQKEAYTWYSLDVADYVSLEKLMRETKVEAVIHLGSIPDPLSLDARIVHNNNVVGSYNIMQTAVSLGIMRIVQASSVNATGLSYTPDDHHRFYEMPVTEKHPLLPVRPSCHLTFLLQLRLSKGADMRRRTHMLYRKRKFSRGDSS
jgi:nucleoside-diphosphate-sugar epimerase